MIDAVGLDPGIKTRLMLGSVGAVLSSRDSSRRADICELSCTFWAPSRRRRVQGYRV